MSANVESMMYTGERPWHGLGTPLDHPATAEEAIRAAKLDWGVELVPAYAEGQVIPRTRAVVRDDRREPIAVVGERYELVQNAEAFTFFDEIVGAGKAIYQTAGSLDHGRRIWLLAKVPGDVWVTKDDQVGKHLLLTNSHDGGSPLRVLFTPIRVVCQNTLIAAMEGAGRTGVSIRHVGDVLEKAKEAQKILGISMKFFDDFEGQARAFASRSVTSEALDLYFRSLVPDPKEGAPSRAITTRESLLRLFESGKGNDLPGVRGTLWAAVNAVTEYVDYERPTRRSNGTSQEEKRFESAVFGSGAALKGEAWGRALTLVS